MKWFVIILLGFGVWGLSITPPLAGAVCRIENTCGPGGVKSDYDLTADEYRAACPAPAGGPNTYPLCCYNDSAAEVAQHGYNFSASENASSLDARKAPVCSTANETIPSCASCFDGAMLICSGLDRATGQTDQIFYDSRPGGIDVGTKPFMFNGHQYQPQAVYFCRENVFGCTQSNCRPLFDFEQPSDSESGGSAGPQARSQTDSRLSFPHVKNTSALTYLLQSFFRPFSLGLEALKQQVIYSRIDQHQTDNNASLIPGQPAPSPPFNFDDPRQPTGLDATCTVNDFRTNSGDDLLGKKIYADLEYTQRFTYELDPGYAAGTCLGTGSTYTLNPGQSPDKPCCGQTTCVTDRTGRKGCTCEPKYTQLPTKGKALVYTKSPYLEYLYQNLVAGPMAVYKRFVSADTAANIQDVPAQSVIKVTASETSRGSSDLNRTPQSVYFPHLGSIYDYFLKNLQKLLLPTGSSGGLSQSPPDGSPQETCVYSEGQLQAAAEAAANQYRVSKAALLAISKIEGSNKYVPGQPYTCSANSSRAVGPMQITDYTYLESGPNFVSPEERLPLNSYSCGQTSGKLNRCNIYDAMEMAARLLRLKMAIPPGTGIGDVTTCENIYHATCKYYGGVCTDNLTRAWKSRVANPPTWNMSYADIVFALGKQYYGLNCPYIPPNCALYGCD